MRKAMILYALMCLTLCAAGCSPDQDRVGEADIEFHRGTEAPLQQDTTEEDSVADSDVKNYIVSLNFKGVLGWESKYKEIKQVDGNGVWMRYEIAKSYP